MHKVKLAKDFSRHPAGRYKSDGPFSGQYFREKHLAPYIKRGEQVEVDLDGARGYGSSFLEEAFGGLVRLGNSSERVLKLVRLISNSSALSAEIKKYIVEAGRRTEH